MLTVNPAPTTGASCQEGLADSGTAAARVLQSPVSSIQSPVLDLPLSCVSAFAVLYLHRLNTPCLNTLLDVGAMASAAFCSTAACSAVCQGPRRHYWAGFQKQPKAALLCFFDPCPARRFPRFWGHPLALLGGTNPGRFARNVPMVPPPLLPDKIEVDICGEIQQPKSACVRDRASWETFPRKK